MLAAGVAGKAFPPSSSPTFTPRLHDSERGRLALRGGPRRAGQGFAAVCSWLGASCTSPFPKEGKGGRKEKVNAGCPFAAAFSFHQRLRIHARDGLLIVFIFTRCTQKRKGCGGGWEVGGGGGGGRECALRYK